MRGIESVETVIGGLGALLVLLLAPAAIGHIALRPVMRAVKESSQPTQFQLTDFVWLILQLQVVLGVVVAYVPREMEGSFAIILGFGSMSTIAMWWGAVRTMLKAGVRRPLRRGLFVLFLLPAVLLLMIGGTTFVIAMPIMGIASVQQGEPLPALPLVIFGLPAGILLIGFFCWALRQLAIWIVTEPIEAAAPQEVM